MKLRTERLGLLFAGLCAANGAFVPAFAKLTTNAADPVFVATATTLFGALSAGLILAGRGELPVLVRRDVGPQLLLVGALGTTLGFMLFFSGAHRATAIDTVICLQSEPAYSLLAAWIFLGHRPTRRRVIAIAALIAGISLAVGRHGLGSSSGVWLVLATPLCWQASHLVVLRYLGGISPSVLTGARYVHGGLLLLLYWLVSGGPAQLPAPAALVAIMPLLAVQGLIISYLGTLLWYQAITRIDLARATAIVVPSVPLLSLGATFVLLGEIPSISQWLGLVVTAAGVLAFVTAPHASAPPATAAGARTAS